MLRVTSDTVPPRLGFLELVTSCGGRGAGPVSGSDEGTVPSVDALEPCERLLELDGVILSSEAIERARNKHGTWDRLVRQ